MNGRDRGISAVKVLYNVIPRSLVLLLLPLWLFIDPTPASSQLTLPTGDRKWMEFTTESGLPSNHVYYVVETRDGTVWAGTSAGLAWYDGYRWCRIDTPSELRGERVWSMTRFSHDSLLVNAGGGLYAGNRFGFHLTHGQAASSVIEFSDNALLLCINNSLYTSSGGRISPLLADSALTQGKTYAVIGSNAGTPYAVLRSGLYRWNGKRWNQVLSSATGRLRMRLIQENEPGTMVALISTPVPERGLVQIKQNKLSVLRSWTSGDYIVAADLGANDDVVLARESGTLELIENGVTKALESPPSGFRNIELVQFRPNGDIWVGTASGLYLYMKVPPRWSYLPRDSMGIRNRIHEIILTKDGSLWTATADGLVIFRKDGRRDLVGKIDGENLNEVTGLVEDDGGDIWISSGSSFDGAYRFDGTGWRHYDISDDPEGVQFHKIRKDRQGRLWFLGLGKTTPLQGAREPGAFVY
jgi:hypothetical protein